MNRTLPAHGFPVHPVSAYRTFVGEGVRKLVERALPPGTEDVREAFVAAYQADYAEHLLDETRLFPGIPEVLDRLAVGERPRGGAEQQARGADAAAGGHAAAAGGSSGAVFGERPGVPRKPDPTSALALADALAAPPETVAFVGDTSVDMLTARAASMRPVGVLWGFRPKEVLASGAEAAGTGEELARILGVDSDLETLRGGARLGAPCPPTG